LGKSHPDLAGSGKRRLRKLAGMTPAAALLSGAARADDAHRIQVSPDNSPGAISSQNTSDLGLGARAELGANFSAGPELTATQPLSFGLAR
jgi:hypothetical protein